MNDKISEVGRKAWIKHQTLNEKSIEGRHKIEID
jgi:hypothetical protein